MEQNPVQAYETTVLRIARLYYGLYIAGRQWTDVDCSDLEQAGRMAVFNVASKRPEMLGIKAYVSAAIKYSVFDEMRKMRHEVKQIYLAHQHEEEISIVDVLPTRETAPERLEPMDDLLYHIRQEFSLKEADALDSLVQKCENVYDLNLSSPPSTDTKDRVRIVTAMDLDDEEMMVYAQVLTGARQRFRRGYLQVEKRGKERAQKYLTALLGALELSPQQFAASNNKSKTLRKYRLEHFLGLTYANNLTIYLQDIDSSIRLGDVFKCRRWQEITPEEVCQKIDELRKKLKKEPKKLLDRDFREGDLSGMLGVIFSSCHKLAVEFAYPRTYHDYQERAQEIRRKYSQTSTVYSK